MVQSDEEIQRGRATTVEMSPALIEALLEAAAINEEPGATERLL